MKIKLTKEQMQMVAAGVMMTAAFSFVYYKYFWSPLSQKTAQARQELEEATSKIEKAQRQAGRLPQLKKQIDDLNVQAEEAEKKLPQVKDVPGILDTLSGLASKYRVDITAFTPQAPAPKQFFIEIPYAITLRGTYHEVAKFLAAVALEERIFNIRGIAYSGAQGAAVSVSATGTLIAYQYKG